MSAYFPAVVGAVRVSPRGRARFHAGAALARRGLVLLLGAALLVSVAAVHGVELRPDAPSTYTVQTGDTMWSIAGRFLRDPWRWREVWRSNSDVGNPDLIYPGDVLRLTMVDGRPRIGVDRSGASDAGYQGGMRVFKLHPRVRVSSLKDAVPTIPIAYIGPFLTQPYVAESDQVKRAPYVVGFPDERIVAGIGDTIYVRRIDRSLPDRFQVLRPGDALRDPKTNEVLGYEATFVANAALERVGDPAKLRVLRVDR
jgi:LysM repeat protein